MSVVTSQRLNADQLQAQLPGGATFTVDGTGLLQDFARVTVLPQAVSKTLTVTGATDAQLQTAITAAAAAFADRTANQAAIRANVLTAQAQIQTFIANNPGGATLTGAQTLVLAKMLNGLCKLLLTQFDATTGT